MSVVELGGSGLFGTGRNIGFDIAVGKAIVNPDPDQRRRGDLIPPENYPRDWLDRTIGDVNRDYLTGFGPAKTPLQASIDRLRRNGSVDLLDVGCGTGNTVRTWGIAAARAVGISETAIGRTGVSLHDYSDESMSQATRRANRDGSTRYVVGNAERMQGIPDSSVDVALANYAVIYSKKPIIWLEQMWRVTRRGGVLFFDLSEEQNYSQTPVTEYLLEKDDKGNPLDMAIVPITLSDGSKRIRALCILEKPN